ncbi:hypothetical protein RSOLAG1IB_07273 [Rhizoctonia solani AG-1 IB]|uniref:Uncharacterized protein n=1 Tax=Thanatephorus cucumeris (strain AG1-IB / isolate 7/3/14) TaxID=1108050 RepID=A0A0B7FCV7_THACB|nr:hypothetical protein RSOLAG1IB_07273 [Rhizoctonia solani AG-1 IB]
MEASESNSISPRIPKGNIASVSIPQDELEALLLSINTLELKGVYPRWASKAYYGLVELHLDAYSGVSIPETDFRAILSSSPGLRHLNFGLKIIRASPNFDRPPILLEQLQVLVTGKRSLEELGLFLRTIHPGSRPLSIHLDKSGKCSSHPDIPRVPFNHQIQAFFTRANVEMLSIAGTYNYSQVAELLGLVSRARAILLNGLCLGNIKPNTYMGLSGADHCFNDLYLLQGTTVAQHFLVWLIKSHSVQRLRVTEDSKIVQSNNSDIADKLPLIDDALKLDFTYESIPSKEH